MSARTSKLPPIPMDVAPTTRCEPIVKFPVIFVAVIVSADFVRLEQSTGSKRTSKHNELFHLPDAVDALRGVTGRLRRAAQRRCERRRSRQRRRCRN